MVDLTYFHDKPEQEITDAAKKSKLWGELAKPVDPAETQICMRAQSILSGPLIGQCPTLTLKQAADVILWHTPLI